ncbi:MAG TPA: type II secretion system F family protein, partial [Acidimicrobiales bacterium]|nr:type II secretion system F family protein [Acidimicrobiales bacterium]
MPLYIVFAALAVTLSVPILWLSLVQGRVPNRQVRHNLSIGAVPGGGLRQVVLSRSLVERIVQPVFATLARPARRLSPAGMVSAIERRLRISGSSWSLERVLVLKLVLGGALLTGGLVYAFGSGSTRAFLVALAVGLVGYLGPDTVLARMATARQLLISHQLPDTLDQLTICVEAGLGFDAAMARTSSAGRGPLAEEVTRLLQELRVGVPRAEALENLLCRTDVPELRQFVHALIQAEVYGAPISRVLRTQAIEQREKRRFRAEERAMKLPVKVIFPMVFCILPTLFIV